MIILASTPLTGNENRACLYLHNGIFRISAKENENLSCINIKGRLENAATYEIRNISIAISIGDDETRKTVLKKDVIASLDSNKFESFDANFSSDDYVCEPVDGITDKDGIKYAPLSLSQIIDRINTTDSVYVEWCGLNKNNTRFKSVYRLNKANGTYDYVSSTITYFPSAKYDGKLMA